MSGKVGAKHYPQEIREKIIHEYERGKNQSQLSREYGISRYAIQCWIGKTPKKETIPKFRKRKPAKTLEEYKNENRQLRMENELLRDFLSLTERK